MAYWVGRIILRTGEVVTERELRHDENRFHGPPPVVDDLVEVECRGRRFMATVIWGNWPGRTYADEEVVRLRVSEVGLDPATPLRFPRMS